MGKNLFLSYIIQDAYQNLSKRDVEKNVNNIIHENVSLQYSIPILPTKRDIAKTNRRVWERSNLTREYPFLFNTYTLVTQSLSTDYAYTRKNRVSRGWAPRPIPCTRRDKYFYNFYAGWGKSSV